MEIFRKKSIEAILKDRNDDKGLKKVLGKLDLTSLGIGAIVGTGVFVITGVAASGLAGPGIIISFLLAAVTCALSALSYAEFASTIPVSGSAYTYAYAVFGEIVAWLMGWTIILEYSVAISSVALGWSGYLKDFLKVLGFNMPAFLTGSFLTTKDGILDLPSLLIIMAAGALLLMGVRQSNTVNKLIVLIKLTVIVVIVFFLFPNFKFSNWNPFLPFGLRGIISGSAMVFFAYIGFDAVASAAEEVKNPQKDLPVGILLSLATAAVLYIAVSGVLTGVVRYEELSGVTAPVSFAMVKLGKSWGAGFVSAGILVSITSVILVMLLAVTRIIFSISRDGLLPPVFSHVSGKTRVPVKSTILAVLATGTASAFFPLDVLAGLTNIGALGSFAAVSAGIIVLRYKNPDLKGGFRCPWVPFIPAVAAALCIYLMTGLGIMTWLLFILWIVMGAAVYFLYSQKKSRLNQKA